MTCKPEILPKPFRTDYRGSQSADRATTTPRPTTKRDPAIDACKGIAILAVVGIHITGHFARKLAPGGPAWAVDLVANRLLQFAVPSFLMLSAWVIGRKLYALAPTKRFTASWSRIPRIVMIYLAASALYLADSSRHIALTPAVIQNALAWGKASFHLYFLVILIQLIAVLPIATLFVRSNWSLRRIVAGAAAVQILVYAVNRWALPAPYPGTVIGWYAAPCLIGVWLAARGTAGQISRNTTGRILWVAIIATAAYLPFAIDFLAGVKVVSFAYQATEWAFTASAALLALAGAQRLPPGASGALAALGRVSLPIYLFHPLVIEALDHFLRVATLPVAIAMPGYFTACLAAPLIFRMWPVISAPRRQRDSLAGGAGLHPEGMSLHGR